MPDTYLPCNPRSGRLYKPDQESLYGIYFLLFEDWYAAPVDEFHLEEAWVLVRGCPYKLRCDFLTLFAVGSLIGKGKRNRYGVHKEAWGGQDVCADD